MKCLVMLFCIAYITTIVESENHDLHVKLIDDTEGFKTVHPGVHVEYLNAHSFNNVKEQKNYYIGSRINGKALKYNSTTIHPVINLIFFSKAIV